VFQDPRERPTAILAYFGADNPLVTFVLLKSRFGSHRFQIVFPVTAAP